VADRRVEARDAQRRPGDTVGAYTRIDRAERLLDWRPRYDVTDGIRHSLQWAAIRDQILPAESDPTAPPNPAAPPNPTNPPTPTLNPASPAGR
jgi:hypothetical protein